MATVAANAYATRRQGITITPALAVAAFASIGAGAIHAAAIGAHSEHRQVVITFTIVAAIQLAWGVLALLYSNRWFILAGAACNTAFFIGWVLAKTSGISFIDGLEVVEKVQLADFVAAAFALAAVLGAVVAVFSANRPTSLGHSAFVLSAVVTAVITVPTMVAAGSHSHAGGHSHGDVAGAGHTHSTGAGGGGGGHSHGVVAPVPYDPDKPIDLGGVPGVSLQQQARAENLIAITLLRLPKFADPAVAEANGFHSIGDALTGDEHYINVNNFDDGRILDPDYPESLVYEPDGKGGKKLAAAMYMLAPNQTLDDVPDIGGKLTQWHIHDNLCFTPAGRVAGITSNGGPCAPGLNKGSQAPMIHVWIEKHACGPFAALEGVGAGQIKSTETRLCDTAHSH
jgi:hypothetical protein